MTDEQKPIVFERDGVEHRLAVYEEPGPHHARQATTDDLRAAGWAPASELAKLRAQLEAAQAWPAPPPGESLHKATLELLECAKAHEDGSRLLGNVTAFSIQALCEYSLNYAFKNASAKRIETAERELAELRTENARLVALLGLPEIPEACAEYAPNGYGAEIERVVSMLLASDLDTEDTVSKVVARLVAERPHLLEAAELLRAIPGFWAASVEWKQRRVEWLHRDQAKAAEPEATVVLPALPIDPEDERIVDGLVAERAAGLKETRMVAEETVVARPWVPMVGDCVRFRFTPPGARWYKVMNVDARDETARMVCDDGTYAGWHRWHDIEPVPVQPTAPVVEQDPMGRPVTVGMMCKALNLVETRTRNAAGDARIVGVLLAKLSDELERMAKGGGK